MSLLPITVEDWQAFKHGFLWIGGVALALCCAYGFIFGIIALAFWLNNPIPVLILIPIFFGLIGGIIKFVQRRL